MSIAPIVRSVEVKASPARAFDLFASGIGQWWPANMTIGPSPPVAIKLEPHVGGAWFETAEDGTVTRWGDVLAWDPPSRLLLAWRISSQWAYDPDLLTEVELSFEPLADGRTRVTLEHRKLEAFGANAAKHAEQLGGGWPGFLVKYAEYVETQG
jgi:uncharacterized protein YndB with AHSA1/START domain